MYNMKIYLVLLAILAASFAAYHFIAPDSQFIKDLVAIPMVGSLGAALLQSFRDIAAHQRSQALQSNQQHFAIGASSHMADVAFDKHICFSEAYVKEAQSAVRLLFRDGASEEVLGNARNLFSIREDYAVWLTASLEKELDIFEKALREIGAAAGFVKSTIASPQHQEARQKMIPEMYKAQAQILGLAQWEGEALTDDLAVVAVVRKLRQLLGTEELTELRQSIIYRASSALKRAS